MKLSIVAAGALLSVGVAVGGADAQVFAETSGPAQNGSPAWSLKGSFADPGGYTSVAPGGVVTALARPQPPPRPAGAPPPAPACKGSPLCGNRLGPPRNQMQRVLWQENLGYAYAYPIDLPAGTGGVPAVALDSKDNLWVFQRKPAGMAQLLKYDRNNRLVLQVGDDVIGHHDKAHGMAVDADDNVWISTPPRRRPRRSAPTASCS